MKIALIQQHAERDPENNLQRGIQAFRAAAENGADLIAFAELGMMWFLPQKPAGEDFIKAAEPIPGPCTEVFSDLSRRYGVVTVLNMFERAEDRAYDASPVINADGKLLGVTRMAHVMDGKGFHEKGYYTPGDNRRFVYDTAVGRVGVAICYDRHFPEYMRNLALEGAELVVIPQAGALEEWTPGLFEAEIRTAAFQNGYFAALVNRVGKEDTLHFAGESFVVDPNGRLISQAARDADEILYAEIDPALAGDSTARRYFLKDRRPEYYREMKIGK